MTAMTAGASRRDTILVVDDEADILTALEDLFEGDYRVLSASSGAAALEIVGREPRISVIISDQRMPGMTGDAFLRRARGVTDAEALLLTGYADLDAVVSALNQGRIVGYVPKPWDPAVLQSMVRTAAERHRLARELDVERALLHGLLDHSDDAISFKDASGRFLRLNQVKADGLQRSLADCLARRESELVDARETEALDQDAMASGAIRETLDERPVPGSGTRWIETLRIPLRDASGANRYLATIERDVTERKALEQRLRQADKMQALGTLAGGVAHDFNNVLMAVLGNLDLASRSLDNPERLQRLLTNAQAGASRGASLTRRLLDFSRVQDHDVRPVDLNRAIGAMHDLLASSLGSHVQIRYELGIEDGSILADTEQLDLAILNLAINARDAMSDGGTITIATERRVLPEGNGIDLPGGVYVAVIVRDTGAGIAPDIVSRVFEPFFTTKDVGQGTGLGLTMVYGFVQSVGGAVDIISKTGEGTSVELYFPEADAARSAAPAGAEAAGVSTGRLNILLVDDDPQVRDITHAYLGEMGHGTTYAASAAQALKLLEAGGFDLLIADIAMPGMTGTELADAARRMGFDKPILLITGFSGEKQEPSHPFLMKPFQKADLEARIATLCSAVPIDG